MQPADLETPLRPDTEYYDATPTLEVAIEELKKARQEIEDLTENMTKQLHINMKVIGLLQTHEARIAELEGRKPNALILPERLNS